MMELGALVCSPAEPACERCPLLAVCRAGNSADPTTYPQFPPGKATVRVTHCSALLSNLDDPARVLVVQRPPHGLWGGLWEFPRRVAQSGESPADCAARAAREVVGLEVRIGERLETVRHGVTHHAVTLHGFLAHSPDEPVARDCDRFAWVTEESLADYPLASPQALLAAAWKRHREEERQGRRQYTLF
jgi:A/G-specific adenine glycosylase